MSLPYAFAQSGWIVGIFFLLIVALLSYSTMSLIIAAVHLTRARLRRRKQATSAHARRTRVAQQKALEGGDAGDESGDEPNTETKEYGTFDAESRSLSSTPFGSPSVSDRAVDPLDLSVIEQDPDLDVIGYQQVAYVAYGEWSDDTPANRRGDARLQRDCAWHMCVYADASMLLLRSLCSPVSF